MKTNTILWILGAIIGVVILFALLKKFAKPKAYDAPEYEMENSSKGTPPPLRDGEGFDPGEVLRVNGVSWTWTGSSWV
jgi:hypothetical protein